MKGQLLIDIRIELNDIQEYHEKESDAFQNEMR